MRNDPGVIAKWSEAFHAGKALIIFILVGTGLVQILAFFAKKKTVKKIKHPGYCANPDVCNCKEARR